MNRLTAIKKISIAALLMAFSILFTRFLSVPLGFFRLSLGSVPILAASLILGPLYGGIVGAASDFFGNAIIFGFGSTLPWPLIASTLQGVLPWLLFYLLKKVRKATEKVAPIFIAMALVWIAITVSVFILQTISVPTATDGSNTYTLDLPTKLLISAISLLVLIGLAIGLYFINKAFSQRRFNSDGPNLLEVATMVFIIDLLLEVIYSPLWKLFTWNIDYLATLFIQIIIFVALFPLKVFLAATLVNIYFNYLAPPPMIKVEKASEEKEVDQTSIEPPLE